MESYGDLNNIEAISGIPTGKIEKMCLLTKKYVNLSFSKINYRDISKKFYKNNTTVIQ